MSERIESMKQFITQYPENPFPRYALALEYKNAGRSEDAVTQFRELAEKFPGYVAGYLQCGMLLRDLGRTDEAKSVVERGIEAAQAARDNHALSELQGVLNELED